MSDSDKDKQGFLARLKAFLKTEFGDEAEKIISAKQSEVVEEVLDDSGAAKTVLPDDADSSELLAEAAKKLVVMAEENQRLQAENDELEAQLEDKDDETQTAEFSELFRRKVRPRHRAAIRALVVASQRKTSGVAEFSENGKNKPLTPAIKEFLNSLPDVVEFSEVARKDKATKPSSINPLIADAERRAAKK